MRALLMGWFTTVGDLEVLHQVQRCLTDIGVPFDVGAYSSAVSRHIPDATNIYAVDPSKFTHLLVICGPFNPQYLARRGIDLDRFSHCTRIGVNLTMLEDLDTFNPFDIMLGRDSNLWARPDVSFLEDVGRVPVAGLCLIKRQGEYGKRQMHDRAADHLRRVAERAGLATLNIYTEWPQNANGTSSPERFESVCARLDVVLTNRLHGMVLALKVGTPVLAIDAISGGGKVIAQANAINWPEAFTIDNVTDEVLDASLTRCLQPPARTLAKSRAVAAGESLAGFANDLARALQASPRGVPTKTAPSRWRRLRALPKRFRRVQTRRHDTGGNIG